MTNDSGLFRTAERLEPKDSIPSKATGGREAKNSTCPYTRERWSKPSIIVQRAL